MVFGIQTEKDHFYPGKQGIPVVMYGGCGEGAQEEAEDRQAAAGGDSWVQVWITVLQVLPSGSLEECELGHFCSCPDSELGGRSPVHTGPGQHLWDVCCWWVGPWHVVTRIFHPTCIKSVLFAPGGHLPGHSLPTAMVSVLPPGGQVTRVQTERAVTEVPLPLSPGLPPA